MAGVGAMPTSMTSQPTLSKPLIKASLSISPLTRVSLPTTTRGFSFPSLLSIVPKAMPILRANSGVIFSFAIPLTPKVPKSLPILPPHISETAKFTITITKMYSP